MPPRNPDLPEGTDHIVTGAMETGATTTSGGASTGFIGSAGDSGFGDGTGGATLGGSTNDFGGASGGSTGAGAISQLKDGATSLKSQATDKVRAYAEDGKTRATSALDDFSKVVNEAADSIDEKLGAEYGQYARKAADAVQGFATNLREKEVDELYDDARALVRKSPAIAIGTAAALGFALVRLLKAGTSDPQGGASSATGTGSTRGAGFGEPRGDATGPGY